MGLIGLAAVVLLIGVASMIMRAVTREHAVAVQPDVVANMTIANASDSNGEPLADLGVTASAPGNGAAPRP